jgi:hypothetical protein
VGRFVVYTSGDESPCRVLGAAQSTLIGLA